MTWMPIEGITADQFRERLGRDPEDDDLERVNCESAGLIGHRRCGWCHTHKAPLFQCACPPAIRFMQTWNETPHDR